MSDWPIELTLPPSISSNRYWRSLVPKGWTRAVVTVSKEAKDYKAACQRIARQARVVPLVGPVEYEMDSYPNLPKDWAKRARLDPVWWDLTVQAQDIDNQQKVILDALNGIAWTDDSKIRRSRGEIMVPDGEARVVIRVRPYVRPHPQVALPIVDRAAAAPRVLLFD